MSEETYTIHLSESLCRRIGQVLENDALGYIDLMDFVHGSLRRELDIAERKAFHLQRQREGRI